METLVMQKMGCDFMENEPTDLTNHRYYIHDIELEKPIERQIKKYNSRTNSYEYKTELCTKLDTIEIISGARYNEKMERIDMLGIWVHTYWNDSNGQQWGNVELEKMLNKGKLYNKRNILETINSISKIKYNEIKEV